MNLNNWKKTKNPSTAQLQYADDLYCTFNEYSNIIREKCQVQKQDNASNHSVPATTNIILSIHITNCEEEIILRTHPINRAVTSY